MSYPKIIYGTAWKKERTAALVVQAVLQGFRGIDTACQLKHYQENLVGDALETLAEKHGIKRSDIFLQTKYTSIVGQDTSKPLPYDPTASVADQVRSSFATSLRNLHTDYLDSYILHSPLHTPELTMEAWSVLMQLQDEGLVHKIGISNCYSTKLLAYIIQTGGRMIDVVQNRWYEGNGWDTSVVDFCVANGIYYQSFWTLTGSPTLLHSQSIQTITQRLGCTSAQALFRVAQRLGISPLSGSTSEGRMQEGVEAEKVGVTEDEVALVKKTMSLLGASRNK
ncbi:hypothetical protein FRB94_004043 [Tulasnella sp. JGI-2019a]|nr:hypothetical protein FRB94_004043 [Tulasnella sp. JGI-2019a]KAG9010384.1 hypothetical protein FRB93_004224 [Tulasnella sp. JGI-2019a]